jgi:uncharacterized protein (TIRG00374 family)
MKRRIFIGLLLSLLFIYLSFWKLDLAGLFRGEAGFFPALFGHPRIDLHQLGDVLTQVRFGYILLAVLLLIFSLFFRAQRWRILLQPVSPGIRYWPVYAAMNAGYMINNVLPLRLGEVIRAYILGKAENVSKSSVLATIIVERLIDSAAMLLLLGVAIFFFPFPDWIRNGLFYLGAGIIFLIAFLFALLINTAGTLQLLRRLLSPFPKRFTEPILKTIGSFSGGLEILRSSHHYTAILMHTVILEVCYIVSVFVILLTFNLLSPEYPKIIDNPLLASVVLLVIITIGISIPSAPGAVGTFHGIVAFGVSLFGVSPEISLGFAIILHLVNYIPLTLLGLACFWSQHFKLSEVRKQLPEQAG